jgi:hypothetical protein
MREKRQFLLESAGVFAFPIGIFGVRISSFSRQIGIDPITGIGSGAECLQIWVRFGSN